MNKAAAQAETNALSNHYNYELIYIFLNLLIDSERLFIIIFL